MATMPIFPDSEEEMDGGAMPDSELVSILDQHANQAIGYGVGANDEITGEQELALNYYNREMSDVPAAVGTSSVVDGTVAMVVDNGLAAVLKPFVASDETVRFVPRSEEDIPTAEQATEYVNYIFNVDNPGFLILHDWFKDALLTKLGVVKVWWEDQPRVDKQITPPQDDIHAQFLRMQPNYMGEDQQGIHHGTQVNDGRVKVCNVPPEEFRISPLARTIKDAIYTAHVPRNVTRSDLVEMGFDPEIVEGLPAYGGGEDSLLAMARHADENFSHTTQVSAHPSQDIIALRDEYIRVDYNDDGIAEMRRVVRVGHVVLLNTEVDENPFAGVCPIPMPHKVYGLSLADLAVQEQRISTVLWRQTLDNLYKSNNPRPVVGEGAILSDGTTGETLGDVAPGAAILVRDASQLRFEAVPFTASNSIPMMEMVAVRVEQMTGVSRAGQGLDTNAISKAGQTTATEMAMIQSGRNARMEMVARIFAETGVKRLFEIILAIVCKHQEQARVIRLRNKWVPMDPSGWPQMDVSISVGLGIGDKAEQVGLANAVLETMQVLGQTPFASLIDKDKVYNAVKRKFTAAGIKDIDEYLVDPSQQQEQQQAPPPPDPALVKAQADAQLQQQKQQADEVALKAKWTLAEQDQTHRQNLAQQQAEFEAQLAQAKAERESQLAQDKMDRETALSVRQMELAHEHKMTMVSIKVSPDLPEDRPGGALDE